MPDLIAATTAEPRFQTRLLTVLAVLALTLAVLGMYGVLAYAVALRRREFGIRMALGAQSADVVDLVLRRTLALAGTGIVIGSGGAIALTRVLDQSGFLFDVRPTDPTTFALVALGVLVMAVVAGLIPARRARRLDPMVAMRAE